MKPAYLLFILSLSTLFLSGCIKDAERTSYSVPVPIWATGDGDLVEDWGAQRAYIRLP